MNNFPHFSFVKIPAYKFYRMASNFKINDKYIMANFRSKKKFSTFEFQFIHMKVPPVDLVIIFFINLLVTT